MSKNFLWVERYRPITIEETILPEDIKSSLQGMVSSGELQNMLFTGTAGLGKTTAARALCNELKLDYIVINGSEEGNIDTLRGKIKQFASTVSLMGGYKVVILDEADYLNPQSTQPALRGFIEQFSDNCRFILTCNFKNRIIEPLHSRCGVYEFNVPKKDSGELAEQFMDRLKYIASVENIGVNNSDIANLIMKHLPDWRRVINEFQRNCKDGVFNAPRALASGDVGQFEPLFDALKNKEFKKMRSWVANNLDLDSSAIIRAIYDNMNDRVKPASIPQLVLILADYQYKASFVADHELNLVACMTEVMANAEWN
jgi:DNA polymerase III delta prime subunit